MQIDHGHMSKCSESNVNHGRQMLSQTNNSCVSSVLQKKKISVVRSENLNFPLILFCTKINNSHDKLGRGQLVHQKQNYFFLAQTLFVKKNPSIHKT